MPRLCPTLAALSLAISCSTISACGDDESAADGGSPGESTPAATATLTAAPTTDPAAADRQVRKRVESAIDFPGADAYLIERVSVDEGNVKIYTGIGADADGETAAGGICPEVWGLQGEEAPKGVERVEILGDDASGQYDITS